MKHQISLNDFQIPSEDVLASSSGDKFNPCKKLLVMIDHRSGEMIYNVYKDMKNIHHGPSFKEAIEKYNEI